MYKCKAAQNTFSHRWCLDMFEFAEFSSIESPDRAMTRAMVYLDRTWALWDRPLKTPQCYPNTYLEYSEAL